MLGDRDEIGGRDEPALGMVPAKQRLERADAVMFEVEQGLVEQFELIAFEGEAQIGLQLPALLRAFVEALLKEGVGAAARLLGGVKRQVRAAQQGAAVFAVLRSDGDANAGRQSNLVAVDDNRLGDRSEDGAREPVDRVTVVAHGLEHDELVAAEPRDEMATRRILYAPAGFDQQCVAGGMTEGVIDGLELGEIQAMQREE